ncbi:MAG: transporter substrate-binding domain-containing protein [Clostridia bacterium]|nr:transporter substrate-binding domain-containing protein [Clostridia bacterium]
MYKRLFAVIFSLLMLLSSCSKNKEIDYSEKILAVETASLASEAAESVRKDFEEVKEYSTLDAVVSAVETEVADFAVIDEFTAGLYIGNERKIKLVKELPFTTEYHIYFKKGSSYVEKFNAEILELTENGTIEAIKESYKSGEVYYPELTELPSYAPTLTAAVAIVGEPYSDLDDNGYVTGIDINIATLISNSLGCNLEIMVDSGDEIFKMLEEGKVDFIISGLLYEEERLVAYDCSFSYLTTEYAIYKKG